MPFNGKKCPSNWVRASDVAFRNLTDLTKHVNDVALPARHDEERLNATRKLFEKITKYTCFKD